MKFLIQIRKQRMNIKRYSMILNTLTKEGGREKLLDIFITQEHIIVSAGLFVQKHVLGQFIGLFPMYDLEN